MKTPPTLQEILHVRRLVACGLYDIATVVRLTGVSVRDVFRIRKSLRKRTDRTLKGLGCSESFCATIVFGDE